MRTTLFVVLVLLGSAAAGTAEEAKQLAQQATTVLKTHCYRCHGQDGSVEGAVNFVTDLPKLVARKKVVPNDPKGSRLFRRMEDGTMPPPDEQPRPSAAEIAALKRWIEAGAPTGESVLPRAAITQGNMYATVLADLETLDRRARRFQRYFTLTHLHNAGLSDEELQTYRNALSKLVNSLSWGSKIVNPVAVDANRTVLRIDLRWYVWDATIWNRVLQEYPYGVLDDSVSARAVAVGTATKQPIVRADWFVATASRAPLYYDVLQLPGTLADLEKLIRVDSTENIKQERVARVGFNGSGISRFNRILERHDSAQGMYWRTYDFDEPPANLVARVNGGMLADRRNIFAFPLGPGGLTDNPFQHAGGEAIFALPNGLHAFYLASAVNARLDKGPLAIVSDPKRPDRAVEAGVSCMSCHVTGILPKADQVRDYLDKNPKALKRTEADVIRSLYPGQDIAMKLMEADAKRYGEVVAKTGARVSRFEAVSTITQKYETEVDLSTGASEVGLSADEFRARISNSETLVRHIGSLRIGGTVTRQIWAQAFGDIARELQLGGLYQANLNGPTLKDNTGELDPLEARGDSANQWAFAPGGRRALVASGDRSVRYYDVEARRDIKRLVGHTASVWAVALTPDGKFAASGGMDGTARAWDLTTGLESARFDDHTSLVSAVAFAPNGKWIVSGSFDGSVVYWKTVNGQEGWRAEKLGLVTAIAVDPQGAFVAVTTPSALVLLNLANGREFKRYGTFAAPLSAVAISPNGKWIAAGNDLGTVYIWQVGEEEARFTLTGHEGGVRSVAIKDGRWVITGGTDRTLRLWDTAAAKQEVAAFRQHTASVTGVAFLENGTQTVSGDGTLRALPWKIDQFIVAPADAPNKELPKAPDRIPYARP
ncbi:WD domain, G-beta repeat [Gemmata obscuriglobus]|nr:c-type cytochrome domain-containing protein [Gemmata obscuriglobus]QEG28663.1 WD domain, G-beta repeat [Gemmata obscuriglobus]VTS06882.1 wd-40 repeat-containing regulatory protein : Protein containing planctomycete cytochrome C domain protein OS=Rhodopirellula baltica SH28 GN=RBSH_03329 PE=4 SV=1: PSCyt1: WD40: WD40: WD40 [Gemmata obscuriglobus UQM 2246]